VLHLDGFAELPEVLRGSEDVLVADVHRQTYCVHQIPLDHPHALHAHPTQVQVQDRACAIDTERRSGEQTLLSAQTELDVGLLEGVVLRW
jgi:hypothetical protein